MIIERTSGLWKLWPYWFPGTDMGRVYIAFGKNIYAPAGGTSAILEEVGLLNHEQLHLKQQGHSYWGAFWWHLKYRISKKFRLSQEIEAYKENIKWIMGTNFPFEEKYQYRKDIAKVLSSRMYGNMISYDEAIKVIGDYKKS